MNISKVLILDTEVGQKNNHLLHVPTGLKTMEGSDYVQD